MTGFIEIRTATALKEDADIIAHALVAQRVAASAQVSGPISSVYWWKGEMVESEEWVVTAKTQESLYSQVEQAIGSLHPYEEPAIIAFPISAGSSSYFHWLSQETTREERPTIEEQEQPNKECHIQALDAAYKRLISAATSANRQNKRATEGIWRPREVLAHIAGWARITTYQMASLLGGMALPTYATDAQRLAAEDGVNAAFMVLIGGQTFEQLLGITHQAHVRLLDLLLAQDATIFVPGHEVYQRMEEVITHYLEHAQELEEMTRKA